MRLVAWLNMFNSIKRWRLLRKLASGRVESERSALRELRDCGQPWCVDLLLEIILDDRHPTIQKDLAADTLAEINTPYAADMVLDAFNQSDDCEQRVHLAKVLGDLKVKRAIGPLVDAMISGEERVWWAARQALGRIGSPVVRPLLAHMGAASREVRREILVMLKLLEWKPANARERVWRILACLRDANPGTTRRKSTDVVIPGESFLELNQESMTQLIAEGQAAAAPLKLLLADRGNDAHCPAENRENEKPRFAALTLSRLGWSPATSAETALLAAAKKEQDKFDQRAADARLTPVEKAERAEKLRAWREKHDRELYDDPKSWKRLLDDVFTPFLSPDSYHKAVEALARHANPKLIELFFQVWHKRAKAGSFSHDLQLWSNIAFAILQRNVQSLDESTLRKLESLPSMRDMPTEEISPEKNTGVKITYVAPYTIFVLASNELHRRAWQEKDDRELAEDPGAWKRLVEVVCTPLAKQESPIRRDAALEALVRQGNPEVLQCFLVHLEAAWKKKSLDTTMQQWARIATAFVNRHAQSLDSSLLGNLAQVGGPIDETGELPWHIHFGKLLKLVVSELRRRGL